jgi:hypothetical protein
LISEQLLRKIVKRFRGGLVFKAHLVSLDSRLESDKEEEEKEEEEEEKEEKKREGRITWRAFADQQVARWFISCVRANVLQMIIS